MKSLTEKGKVVLVSNLVINDNNEVLLLFRKDHKHFETPGGKPKPEECKNPENPSIDELKKAAERELHEELGENVKVQGMELFESVNFTIPDGRKAVTHKFVTKISGRPVLNEPEQFSRIEWLPIERLEEFPVSPDLKILAPKLKERFGKQ